MQFYSHLAVADLLKETIKPIDENDYFLSSIVPDIRYYNGMPRRKSHLTMNEIDQYEKQMPELKSFIAGYRLHCLIDERESALFQDIRRHWIIRIMGKRATAHIIKMMVEFYFFDHHKMQLQLHDQHNSMLAQIEVSAVDLTAYVKNLNYFLTYQTFDAGIETFSNLGILGTKSVEKYLIAAEWVQGSFWVRPLLGRILRKPLEQFVNDLKMTLAY